MVTPSVAKSDKATAVVSTSASISLNVYDSNVYPVFDAKVVISSLSLPFPITIHSNQNSVASITYLPVGEYAMDISASQKETLTLSAGQISGNYFTFSIHGEVPYDTKGRLTFYDDNDVSVGSPFKSDITINLNGFNSIDVPRTSIPSGATKIGIELVSGTNQDNLVAKQTKKMWKQKFYEPLGGGVF